MIRRTVTDSFSPSRVAALACGALLLTSACTSGEPGDAEGGSAVVGDTTPEADTSTSDNPSSDITTATETRTATTTAITTTGATSDVDDGCAAIAAQFVTRGSANADLDDPEVSASCDENLVVVESNGIPDYTYIETSPGQPTDRDHTFSFPASPMIADSVTAVPYLGTAAVSLGGIPIFGPTEGTGGDVESLPGILSVCGSHNGPSGFHIHLILTSSETDCLFTPDEVATAPQLVGYAFDGFPIYTGADQYTSSWELTDETLFATDTWAAHSYVEGSGDLDECNGRYDDDGNYAYYTTTEFPYVLGCYSGVVDLDAAGDGGGGDADGERPERPAGDTADGAARPERPERPEPPQGDDAPPEGDDA